MIVLVVHFCSIAQQEFTLNNQQTLITATARFTDSGGSQGQMPNENFSATIKAPSGYIHVFFTMLDLPVGSQLRIFRGEDTTELIGIYDGTYKPMDVYGKSVTIVYYTGSSTGNTSGFEGIVEPVFGELAEKVTLPESDCINAIPLCGNSTVNTSANQYENTGNVNDDSGSCYSGTGSGGSVWYSFSPQTNGQLDFMITPTGSTDYDFVLWDITNGCANKTQLSCNYSSTHAATGLNAAGTLNSQDASGTTNNQLVNVLTTHVYALCINYYGGNNDGFTLNFHNIASTVNIVDNIPPTITSAYSPNCASASTFTINFSEYIDCNTLQASDFSIPGYTVSLVTTNCVNGKTNSVVISVSPSMSPGNYSMTVNNMNDLCGNPLNQVYPINTLVTPVANAGPDAVACSTPGVFGTTNYGSVTLTGSGGTSYIWNTGQTGASVSVTPTSTATYTLTAITGNCSSTDNVTVSVVPSPTPNLGPDQTICSGFPITLNASGGGTYQWQSTTTTGFFGAPTGWANISGATSSSYTGSPTVTTYYQVIVTNAQGCTGTDYIKVTIGSGTFGITAPPFVCEGSSVTLSLPSSMTQYTWTAGGSPIGTANTSLTVTPGTTTTYTATSTTPGCTGSASVTIPVHPLTPYTTSANPTTACPGIPVDLSSTAPAEVYSTQTENFETANSFTLVNGANNKWYYGTAAFANGTKGLYIGTAVGNNNYDIGSWLSPKTAINFAYKNYTVTSYCSPTLSFNWHNNGQSNQAELTVWAVPTSFTPVAGTAITASATNILLGGPYFGSVPYANVSMSLSAFSGQSIRIVFQWRNTGAALVGGPTVANPAACIDDVVFTDNTTYNYTWTSSPAGFTATGINATANPTSATTYTLTTTRCDGCPVASSIPVSDCTPLPVGLLDFDGQKETQYNTLFWTTEYEINSDYFLLERTTDGVNWQFAAKIDTDNDTPGLHQYFWNDYSFEPNTMNYYRLNQFDLNGERFTYDRIVAINNLRSAKKIVKRTNILGQEVPDTESGLLIFIYEDGSMEKIMVVH